MEILTNLVLGVCLSAACGFRVFAPLLVMSLAALGGFFTPDESLAWLETWPAAALFGTATAVEVAAYYVPIADNFLDTIATPAALVAGVLASASVLGELPPGLQWFVAAVAGGGAAGIVQTATVLLRGTSTLTTGGAGNPIVATVENLLSVLTPALALVVPAIVFLGLMTAGVWAARVITSRRRMRPSPT